MIPTPKRETRRSPIVAYIAEHYANHAGLPSVGQEVNKMLDEGVEVTEALVDYLFSQADDDWLTQFRERHIQAREDRRTQLAKPGYVYFLRHGERLKIGYSRKPGERARSLSLRESNIIGVVKAEPRFERVCHDLWAELRIGNTEWFTVTDELLQWIDGIATKWHYRHASRNADTRLDGYQRLAAALGLDSYAE